MGEGESNIIHKTLFACTGLIRKIVAREEGEGGGGREWGSREEWGGGWRPYQGAINTAHTRIYNYTYSIY